MNIKSRLLALLAIVSAFVFVFFSCAQPRGNPKMRWVPSVLLETGRVTDDFQQVVDSGQPPAKLLVNPMGFFNNDHSDRFVPEMIRYMYVDGNVVHEELTAYARGLSWAKGAHVLSTSETLALRAAAPPKKERRYLAKQLLGILVTLDTFVKTKRIPKDSVGHLKAPIRLGPEWDASDRVLVIVGLETLPSDHPERGLAALLGCFWFSGRGEYLAMSVEPYDFGEFRSWNMIQLGRRCFPS